MALNAKQRHMELRVDCRPWFDGQATCVLFSTFGTISGGLRLLPDGRPDDGILQIGAVTATRWLSWLHVRGHIDATDLDRSPLVDVTLGRKVSVKFDRPLAYELDGGARAQTDTLRSPSSRWRQSRCARCELGRVVIVPNASPTELGELMAPASLTHNPVGHLARNHPAVAKLRVIGRLAKEIVYALAGAFALLLVSRSFGWSNVSKEASTTGAIKQIAQSNTGPFVLVALAIGLVVYAAWGVASPLIERGPGAEALATRVGHAVSAIIYTTFGLTALSLRHRTGASANGNQKSTA